MQAANPPLPSAVPIFQNSISIFPNTKPSLFTLRPLFSNGLMRRISAYTDSKNNLMHVSELQTQHISKLLEQAEQLGIENANRLRKQDLVFAIVRQLMRQGEDFNCSGTLETCPMASVSCAAPTPHISLARTTSMSRPTKSAVSTSTPATPSKAPFAYRKTTNATLPSSASIPSTATTPKSANTKSSLKTLPRSSQPNNSSWNATSRRKKTSPAAPSTSSPQSDADSAHFWLPLRNQAKP